MVTKRSTDPAASIGNVPAGLATIVAATRR